jgi:hypothetical protein
MAGTRARGAAVGEALVLQNVSVEDPFGSAD